MQKGPCAFSAACTVPGPRHRLQGAGDSLQFCGQHARTMFAAAPAELAGEITEFARAEYRGRRSGKRRSGWATYVGVADLA